MAGKNAVEVGKYALIPESQYKQLTRQNNFPFIEATEGEKKGGQEISPPAIANKEKEQTPFDQPKAPPPGIPASNDNNIDDSREQQWLDVWVSL